MTRDEAIEALARHDVAQLGPEERESLLLDWWSIDADDPGYDGLPNVVRAVLERCDSPDDPQSPVYDPLLRLAVRFSLRGVLNAYLERRMADLGHFTAIEGVPEELETCPCCGYRSLRERGGYEICRVCFWEDDGTTDPQSMSGPNHMTLDEARRNFDAIGAVDGAAVRHVLRDGRDRYARGERVL
jgi:hypothetical protein